MTRSFSRSTGFQPVQWSPLARIESARNIWFSALLLSLVYLLAPRVMAQEKYAEVSAVLNTTALQPAGQAVIAVVMDVKEGFHAQSNKPLDEFLIPTTVELDANAQIEPLDAVYPPGIEENYPALGKVSVYTGKTVIYIPVRLKADAPVGPIKISGVVRYQACDDKACFQPQKAPFAIETKIVAVSEAVSPANEALFKKFDPKVFAAPKSATTAPAAQGSTVIDEATPGWSLGKALSIAFLAGILFNLMPCVLPVLPLKAIGFYEIAQHNRAKTLMLAGVFSAGLVGVFALLAVLILVTKKITWGEQFSNPIFAWGIVILMFVMALAMFDVFTFALPTSVYNFTPKHDTYTGNFLFGMLTAVLSTPCTAPLFPPLMLWAKAQPVSVGVPAVMMVGVGMAFPYVLLSAFPQMARKFPRVGPWAELVKQMMGFLLLGAAVFFASGQLLHGGAIWWPVVGVAAIGAFYLMGRSIQLAKGALPVGIASVLAVLMLGSTIWVAIFLSVGGAEWKPYSDQALADAQKAGKIVLVKFTANWCLNCQTVEATVFHDKTALQSIQDHEVVLLKADLTAENAAGWPLLKQLNATGGIPLTAVFAPGRAQPVQISSVYTTQTLVKVLDEVSRKTVAEAR